MKRTTILAALSALSIATMPALASAEDWLVKVGAHQVTPNSNNGSLAGGALKTDVDSDIQPTITVEYFFNKNVGVELLASTPFKHDFSINGTAAGSTKHLPPTLSLHYHFNPEDQLSPFLASGLITRSSFRKRPLGH